MNIHRHSVPPDETLQFPATSLEEALGESMPPRELVLHDILAAFIAGRPHLATDDLIAQWEEDLAYKGERVEVRKRDNKSVRGKVIGLASDGSLLLDDDRGKRVTIRFGDVRLRPAA
jgi:biotin-(acetyl-CoA carboxylase) ligase